MYTEINQARNIGILYVDDEVKSLKYFDLALREQYRIYTAENVNDALDILSEHADDIAVLVTDQRMPAGSGLDLLRLTKTRFPHIVRIITTAYADMDTAIEAVNSGAIFRYIVKPWEIDLLRSDMQEAVDLFIREKTNRDLLAARQHTLLQLAGNIAHELRTPLASIRAAASGSRQSMHLLMNGYRAAEQAGLVETPLRASHHRHLADALPTIELKATQASTIIDMLLMNARKDPFSGWQAESCSLRGIVDEVVSQYPFKQAERTPVRITGDGDIPFRGSATLMRHVLLNLLKNAEYAISARNDNDGEITVSLHAEIRQLRFRDSGTGIAPGVLAKIFDDFFTTKIGGVGNGIGLAFCRRALDAMDASISCKSQQGKFTEFTLQLPADDPESI